MRKASGDASAVNLLLMELKSLTLAAADPVLKVGDVLSISYQTSTVGDAATNENVITVITTIQSVTTVGRLIMQLLNLF